MIKVNLKEVLKETFPNGETRLDLRFILEDPTAEKEYFVEWKYESDADFATLHFIVDYIKDNDPKWAEKVTILNILYIQTPCLLFLKVLFSVFLSCKKFVFLHLDLKQKKALFQVLACAFTMSCKCAINSFL